MTYREAFGHAAVLVGSHYEMGSTYIEYAKAVLPLPQGMDLDHHIPTGLEDETVVAVARVLRKVKKHIEAGRTPDEVNCIVLQKVAKN